jgi:hypothetical protein
LHAHLAPDSARLALLHKSVYIECYYVRASGAILAQLLTVRVYRISIARNILSEKVAAVARCASTYNTLKCITIVIACASYTSGNSAILAGPGLCNRVVISELS